jgi:hypothetical protein
MTKYFFSLIAFVAMTLGALAQNAQISSVDFNKGTQTSVRSEYALPADMVEGAMRKKFIDARLGKGSKASDGFQVLKGVVIPEIAKEKIDLYYRVEDKKPSALVNMIVSKGYDNFMKMDQDAEALNNTVAYLDAFVKDATIFYLQDQVKQKEGDIKNLEKDARSAARKGESLQKSKSKLESKIAKQEAQMEGLKTEMETQQRALELVRTKTATIDQMKDLKREVDKQESATKKARNKYETGVKNGANYRESLAKTEREIIDNQQEQEKIAGDIRNERGKLDELNAQIQGLK